MRLCRDIWLACLITLFVFRPDAYAAAVPAYNGRMNAAVGGVIQQKISKWGFAANDPRIGATLGAVGSAATAVAVGVATGGVAAVGWPALLVGAGIAGLVSGAMALGQDALSKWLMNPDGTVSYTYPGASAPVAGMTSGGPYWYASDFNIAAASPDTVARAFASRYNISGWTYIDCQGGSTFKTCYLRRPDTTAAEAVGVSYVSSGAPASCGNYWKDGACGSLPGSGPTTATKPVDQAVADLPDSEAGKELSDVALANAANSVWKKAAGDNSLPWASSDPVTPNDVAEWKAANPNAVPTVSDMTAPAANPQTNTVPVGQPAPSSSTQTGQSPSPTAGTGMQVDLGPDPNIGAPKLESTPTPQMIVDPILNLMKPYKDFALPNHQAECPKPSFTMWEKEYRVQSHCTLIEDHRNMIETTMALFWVLVASFIILRA